MTQLTSSFTAPVQSGTDAVAGDGRRSAVALITGAAATIASGVAVQAVVQPATTVPDDRWSYPWSSTAVVAVSVAFAAIHLVVIVGLRGVRRREPTGPFRWGRAGVDVAIAGTGLLLLAELAMIPVRHAAVDDAGAMVVGALFGLATLVSAVGFLLAGVATARAGQWQDWRRWPLLATGAWLLALTGIAATKALPTGVALYGVGLLATGLALYTSPAPVPPATADARLVTTA
jgi:hypothetical protein